MTQSNHYVAMSAQRVRSRIYPLQQHKVVLNKAFNLKTKGKQAKTDPSTPVHHLCCFLYLSKVVVGMCHLHLQSRHVPRHEKTQRDSRVTGPPIWDAS